MLPISEPAIASGRKIIKKVLTDVFSVSLKFFPKKLKKY